MNRDTPAESARLLRIVLLILIAVSGCSPLASCARTDELDVGRVRGVLDREEYAEAERMAGDLVTRSETARDTDPLSLTQTIDLLVEAKIRNGKANEETTLNQARDVVARKERLVGSDHLEVATSLRNLGEVHTERGEFPMAVSVHERALGIRRRRFSVTNAAFASGLEALALPEILLQRFDQARQHLEQAFSIRNANSASAPLKLSRTLELQALMFRQSGDYSAAMTSLDRATAVRAQAVPGFPIPVSILNLRGDLLFFRGDLSGAQNAWSEAFQRVEQTLGPDNPTLVPLLRRLAVAPAAAGNRIDNRRLLDRALAISQRRLSRCHPEATDLLNDDAQSTARDGDFASAQKKYERAIQVYESCYGPNHYQTATGVHNAGLLAMEMGDLVEAERLQERAIQAWSASLGPKHSYVARGLDALAEVVARRRGAAKAQELYERALDIRRHALGSDHPDVAWTLTNLATTVAQLGDVSRALRYVREAIAIYRKAGAPDEPDHFARVLELQGTLEAQRSNMASARSSLTQALAERIRIFGESHPLVAQTRASLASIELARGDFRAALEGALQAERSGREHLLFTVRYLPERQAMAYAAKRPRGLDLALTMAAAGDTTDLAAVLDAVIRSRGVILDELARRPHLTSSSDPAVASLAAAVDAKRQRFANLVVRSLQEPVPRALLDNARRQKEDAERSLAERSVEARAEMARIAAGLADVRHALPAKAALVSFVRYDRARITGPRRARGGSAPELAYAAFVINSASGDVAFVPLGAAPRIDALIGAWRTEASGRSIASGISLTRAERLYGEASARLRRAVWDPLVAHIGGAPRVFVTSDGLINLVNLAALTDGDGRYLVERDAVFHYLTTERDLLLPPSNSDASQALLAVGGPAFDKVVHSSNADTRSSKRGFDCPTLAQVHFGDLPGSLTEVDEIGALWPKTRRESDVILLRGAAATESAVKRAVVGRRIVHLATHGFFLSGNCAAGLPGLRAVGGIALASTTLASTATENPLLLTGLAFAGANNREAAALDQDDGLLTAEEIAGLNLQGTEWAVLSACDTGLGEIKAGEGVFGLRRAFQIAGARTVIMSLWSVEDESTREWMRALYEGRLQRHFDTAAAVREAGLSILRTRRAKGLSTHPFYWAAFVAAGDWR